MKKKINCEPNFCFLHRQEFVSFSSKRISCFLVHSRDLLHKENNCCSISSTLSASKVTDCGQSCLLRSGSSLVERYSMDAVEENGDWQRVNDLEAFEPLVVSGSFLR
ncbi:hypothetical protein NPIL_87071 [Nephila pilipes]|uniref:Uncharacterized protein n=1 Tax=Nephila pilipes TaxID=299642 RepID=A0A8X6TE83_NEPPI|nr:hypothetical protein NPIL_87071 [Nephila pilipes]